MPFEGGMGQSERPFGVLMLGNGKGASSGPSLTTNP